MDRCKTCYYCGSTKVVKNGKTYYLKQRYKCGACHRQFVGELKNVKLTNGQKQLIGNLLSERISLEGICYVLNMSAYHVYTYMDELYGETPDDLYTSALIEFSQDINLACFACENEQAWSFVGSKANKQ